jgi:endonuclease YncB( thermonuclease family)
MVLCMTLPVPSVAQEIRGNAKVISGNQIIVGKRTVRLFGIAAPGLEDICTIGDVKMRCGIVAWSELIKLADGQYLSCDIEKMPPDAPVAAEASKPEVKPAMKYATCYIGETDLNEALVRSGWAKTVLSQTDRYQVDETDARESKRGLWAKSVKSKKKKRKKR